MLELVVHKEVVIVEEIIVWMGEIVASREDNIWCWMDSKLSFKLN